MSTLQNPMQLFKLLEKSNCRKCNEPTCLAFAAAVYQRKKEVGDCPHLAAEIVQRFQATGDSPHQAIDTDREKALAELKRKVNQVDLASAARRLGATFANNKLTLKVLGKDVSVDTDGNLFSDIHLHAWIAVPFLYYVIEGQGLDAASEWVPLRELKGGKNWYRLFSQRCEKPLKRVADTYTELFADMLALFAGKEAEAFRASDISIMLHPLPKLPMLICYWKPEEGLESELNLFFDAAAESNLNIESIYTLCAGLVLMFEKLSLRHGI
ncbi:MAG: Fe-S cluster protein [Desulfatitalea sp. BRH_c12]|nr:MAG: Fe-S cluster protein [Desulfatitalea sp. BRH_c12]